MKITKLAFYLIVFIAAAIMTYFLSTCTDSTNDEFTGGAFEGKNHEPTAFSLLSGDAFGGVADSAIGVSITPFLSWSASKTYNSGDNILYDILGLQIHL